MNNGKIKNRIVKYKGKYRPGFIFLLLYSLFFILYSIPAHAASVSVTPAILDYKAKARDIIDNGSITITNHDTHQLDLYPVVDNIAVQNGTESFIDPSQADLSSSLANWIEFTRGMIELAPGESRAVPLTIRVNLTAKPGMYHAIILFPAGSSRYEAEQHLADAPSAAINVEVQDDIKENIQLKKFLPAKKIFWGLPASFSFELENGGNRPQAPTGEILIYDNKGKEVADIPANASGTAIDPAAVKDFSNMWTGSGGLGQYRALLSLSYGAGEPARIQDTIFFWVLPWKEVALLAAVLFIVCMGGALWLHRRYGHAPVAVLPAAHRGAIGGLHAEEFPHVVDLRQPRNSK